MLNYILNVWGGGTAHFISVEHGGSQSMRCGKCDAIVIWADGAREMFLKCLLRDM